jgi:hypothetical protein
MTERFSYYQKMTTPVLIDEYWELFRAHFGSMFGRNATEQMNEVVRILQSRGIIKLETLPGAFVELREMEYTRYYHYGPLRHSGDFA